MTNGFKIIGISTRTTNKNNQDIGKLWEKFFSEGIIDKIPNKITSEILAIYTDYASDYTNEYTMILGIVVSTLDEIPDGFVGREFPVEKFQKFVAKGEMPEAIAKTWNEIWSKNEELNRKYSYDFELYTEKSRNGKNSEVEIFVSIK